MTNLPFFPEHITRMFSTPIFNGAGFETLSIEYIPGEAPILRAVLTAENLSSEVKCITAKVWHNPAMYADIMQQIDAYELMLIETQNEVYDDTEREAMNDEHFS